MSKNFLVIFLIIFSTLAKAERLTYDNVQEFNLMFNQMAGTKLDATSTMNSMTFMLNDLTGELRLIMSMTTTTEKSLFESPEVTEALSKQIENACLDKGIAPFAKLATQFTNVELFSIYMDMHFSSSPGEPISLNTTCT